MKPFIENRHVERVLSFIVILYGLGVIIQNTYTLILYVRYLTISGNIPGAAWALSQIIAGCLLLVFFSRVVQGIGYFATEGKKRSARRWFASNLIAVPLILFAFTEILYVFYNGAFLAVICCCPYDYFGVWYNWTYSIASFFVLLVYFVIAIMLLFYARRIAAWLLRISAPKSEPGPVAPNVRL